MWSLAKVFLISVLSPPRSDADVWAASFLRLRHFSTLGFHGLPLHRFPTSRWEKNRRLMCGKFLMGWGWKQHSYFCPHVTEQWTSYSLTVIPKYKSAEISGLTECPGKRRKGLVSSWSSFTTITLHQRTTECVRGDKSWEALTPSGSCE